MPPNPGAPIGKRGSAMPLGNDRNNAAQRKRHAVWAGVIALFLALSTLLMPLDQFAFILQSRLANFQASGDTVFLNADENISDPSFPGRRVQLARTLDSLHELGVEQVYVDIPFSAPSTPEADAELNTALRNFGDRAFLVRHLWSGLGNRMTFDTITPEVGQGIAQVGTIRWRNYFGHVWDMPNSVTDGREHLVSLHRALARTGTPDDTTVINYGFHSIPSPASQSRRLPHRRDRWVASAWLVALRTLISPARPW